ncbi:piggyBac transposable element-derived protein 4-like [Engystomops pustulosus]|uniref:piggyBac transposable element-derived protein 4-like n=1 Tax=Engystomops pustulosus TaxID=76066 RepID=UPI003AFB5AC4
MAQRMFTAEEAYAMICSDTDAASEIDDELFVPSSSSSDSDEPVARRSRLSESQPSTSSNDPDWLSAESYAPQIPDFVSVPGVKMCTNVYAAQFLATHPESLYVRDNMWKPVDQAEMLIFWGLLLNMGLVKKPTIRSYWSTDVLYDTPMYRDVMPRKRFEAIMRFIHYSDNSLCPPASDPSYDRLFKIRPLVKHFNLKFAEVYMPEKNLAIDESLVLFKGRLKFRQYLPSKRAKYGMKVYKVCESNSGFTHHFRVYEGKDSKINPPECPPNLNVSGRIVWDLIHPLLDKGYHLFVDNFYTSVPLFRALFQKNTVACGTIRRTQKGLPKALVNFKLKAGECKALCNDHLLLVKYRDKKDVHVLTTIYANESSPVPVRGRNATTSKPLCIQQYNKNMGGVDLADQMLQPYSAVRKSKVWYKKLAINLVQMALYNSFVIYKKTGHQGSYLDYQEKVIKNLIFGDLGSEARATTSSDASRIVAGQHFPSQVPPTAKKARPQKRCRVCYKNGIRKDTGYQCMTCHDQPGLCIHECFRKYHTSLEY